MEWPEHVVRYRQFCSVQEEHWDVQGLWYALAQNAENGMACQKQKNVACTGNLTCRQPSASNFCTFPAPESS
jgi:hypothetical protein